MREKVRFHIEMVTSVYRATFNQNKIQPFPMGSFINLFTLSSSKNIVCYTHTFENSLGMKQKLTKYLKGSCCLASDLHFSFKLFPENAFLSKIFSKSQGKSNDFSTVLIKLFKAGK